jgi:Ran GTPase-activating protein (RanGAP) involved in mRNA processing and transport
MLLEEYNERAATSMNELESRDNCIKELEEDLSQLRKVFETLQVEVDELEVKGDGEENQTKLLL